MAKRINIAALDLSQLEHRPEGSGGWQDFKWECYCINRNETEKMVTESMVRVNYNFDKLTKTWHEANRMRYYNRRTKYLCLSGPMDGKYAPGNIDGYKLYFSHTYYDAAHEGFPNKVLLHTDSLAKRMGLKW